VEPVEQAHQTQLQGQQYFTLVVVEVELVDPLLLELEDLVEQVVVGLEHQEHQELVVVQELQTLEAVVEVDHLKRHQ
tara:strand:+ start:562 stop:792 length:231 start_codon:yes stop_codon:yes gene_type:complete